MINSIELQPQMNNSIEKEEMDIFKDVKEISWQQVIDKLAELKAPKSAVDACCQLYHYNKYGKLDYRSADNIAAKAGYYKSERRKTIGAGFEWLKKRGFYKVRGMFNNIEKKVFCFPSRKGKLAVQVPEAGSSTATIGNRMINNKINKKVTLDDFSNHFKRIVNTERVNNLIEKLYEMARDKGLDDESTVCDFLYHWEVKKNIPNGLVVKAWIKHFKGWCENAQVLGLSKPLLG